MSLTSVTWRPKREITGCQTPSCGKPAWAHHESSSNRTLYARLQPRVSKELVLRTLKVSPIGSSALTSLLRFRVPGWAMVDEGIWSAAACTWTGSLRPRLRRHAPQRKPLLSKTHPPSALAAAWEQEILTLGRENRNWDRTTTGAERYATELRVPMETRWGLVAGQRLVFQDSVFVCVCVPLVHCARIVPALVFLSNG